MKNNRVIALFAIALMAIVGVEHSAAKGVAIEPQHISNNEYDRLFTADRNFKAIDQNHDNLITASDVDLISWNRYALLAKEAMAECGESVTYDQYLAYYQTPTLDVGGEILQNIEYKRVGDTRLMMDIFMPTVKPDGKTPVLLFYHGGSWTMGDKYMSLEEKLLILMEKMRSRGYAVIAANYRVSNGEDQYVRDCVVDSKDALAYINRNAEEYGFDNENISIIGESAGGHISSMVGLSDADDLPGDKELAPYRIQPRSVVVWYGPCKINMPEFEDADELDTDRKEAIRKFTSSLYPDAVKAAGEELTTLNYIDRNDPPVLVMCGDKDFPEKAYMLHESIEKVKGECEIIIVKNAGHGWWGNGMDPDLDGICEAVKDFIIKNNR